MRHAGRRRSPRRVDAHAIRARRASARQHANERDDVCATRVMRQRERWRAKFADAYVPRT